MNRKSVLILLLLTVTVIIHAQDTLYFDINDKRVASLDSASSYRVYVTDNIRDGNLIESIYSMSGKLRSSCSLLLQFSLYAKKELVEAYTSGQIAWHDSRLNEYIESLKDGTYKEWYENGQLRKEIEYSEGKMNGHYLSYWENGQKKREESYLDGKKSVEGKSFDQLGNLLKYSPLEYKPEFPGGEKMFQKFICENIRYPSFMVEQGVQGKVIVKFRVEKDGRLTNLKIITSPHPAGSKEAMRLISLMPKWKPGILEDEPIPVWFTLPISFSIEDSSPFEKQLNSRRF
ncbi:MAG: TonB family protein [Bacteroidales bacterium]